MPRRTSRSTELRDVLDAEHQLVIVLPELAGAFGESAQAKTLRRYQGLLRGSSLTTARGDSTDERRSWLAGTERTSHIEPKFRLFPWANNPNR
jgi:hypothetical protein